MKKISYLIAGIMLCALTLLYGCSKAGASGEGDTNIQLGSRVIDFAGYKWDVRTNEQVKQGPGPNYFSDSKDNVWLDDAGKLHLKITHKNGMWYGAEVMLKKVYGYGRYTFQVESHLETLDKNVVGALFLYKNDNKEIDIEFSKWGLDKNDNAQFVIQPGDNNGNKSRFPFTVSGGAPTSTHVIDWQKDSVGFASYYGGIKDTAHAGNLASSWAYYGADNPTDQDLRLEINLWLFRGAAPADQKEQELVISGFEIN